MQTVSRLKTMSTLIVLEDGRIIAASNGQFDSILEAVADELNRDKDSLSELAGWLLEQRCEVLGPGVGALDIRELSPAACEQFRGACQLIYERQQHSDVRNGGAMPEWLRKLFHRLHDMWASIARGEPPESLTSPAWRIHPASGQRVGPGW